jgi:ATP-dependent RNA helicase RhlE
MSQEFSGFGLRPSIMRGIAGAGFTEPRPIQTQTIPAALEGRDILGLAQTGTGKTAAFALPLLERLIGGRAGDPRVLILAPTRELASQICEEFRQLGRHTAIKTVPIFGGVSTHSQMVALRQRPDVIVACPGRLLDLLGQKLINLGRIEALVLDEADHMFDMGFLPDVKRILAALPAQRQTLLFSATMPAEIRRLADRQLQNPHVAEIDHKQPIGTIEHALYPVIDKGKLALLKHLIDDDGISSAIVFTRTKHRARRVAQQLTRLGLKAVALQGNMSQNARVRAMDGFRKRDFDILVATDIAARGIDVEKVSHVVNFDMPNTAEAYTHRIGRTGRAEREGKAYTFVTDADRDLVRAVERRMGAPIVRRAVEGVAELGLPPGDIDRRDRPQRGGANGNGQRSSRRRTEPGRARPAAGAARGRRPRRASSNRASAGRSSAAR